MTPPELFLSLSLSLSVCFHLVHNLTSNLVFSFARIVCDAGKPEAPYNCTLTNQTTESLSVECTPGFDGGQTQHFVLEVYDQHTNVLQKNLTSRENAAFTVHGLEPGRILNMKLYAVNSKGRSEPTRLEGFTLKIAEKQTGKSRTSEPQHISSIFLFLVFVSPSSELTPSMSMIQCTIVNYFEYFTTRCQSEFNNSQNLVNRSTATMGIHLITQRGSTFFFQ